jgi:hypothetical protein
VFVNVFVHIFMRACLNAPMCIVRVCRYKREWEDFIYKHAFVCIYTHGHTHAHMYIHNLYVCMLSIREREIRMSNTFTNIHKCTL